MRTLHHRAIIRGYEHSPTLGREFVASVSDIGFEWGTSWTDNKGVMETIESFERRFARVTIQVRDAG